MSGQRAEQRHRPVAPGNLSFRHQRGSKGEWIWILQSDGTCPPPYPFLPPISPPLSAQQTPACFNRPSDLERLFPDSRGGNKQINTLIQSQNCSFDAPLILSDGNTRGRLPTNMQEDLCVILTSPWPAPTCTQPDL